jgi:hypothetical protein
MLVEVVLREAAEPIVPAPARVHAGKVVGCFLPVGDLRSSPWLQRGRRQVVNGHALAQKVREQLCSNALNDIGLQAFLVSRSDIGIGSRSVPREQ